MKTCDVAFGVNPESGSPRVFLTGGGRVEHEQAPEWLLKALEINEAPAKLIKVSEATADEFEVYSRTSVPSDNMMEWRTGRCVLGADFCAPRMRFSPGVEGRDDFPAILELNEHLQYERAKMDPDGWLQKRVRNGYGVRLPEGTRDLTGGWRGPANTLGAWADEGLLIVSLDEDLVDALSELFTAAVNGRMVVKYGRPKWVDDLDLYLHQGLELTVV